ncbi:MAG: hypothetical protein MUE51_04045, partial [Thermoleophilia bacterium]|nr:hypothetical protein [Thermoleophilia bacterium]
MEDVPRPSSPSPRRSGLLPPVLALLLLALPALVPGHAPAAGTPDIGLTVDAPGEVLYGTTMPVTLRVSSPVGQPPGYNLSARVVLPAGVSFAGATAPAPAPRVLQNAPGAGQTTLIWDNLADLSPGSSFGVGFRVAHDPAIFAPGDTLTLDAGVFIQTDPRTVPKFDGSGVPIGSSFTGSAVGTSTTTITAIQVVKEEPSPEGELMRGVHDHRTIFTIRVRNNAVRPTTGIDLDDWLPAGLEFLGCGVGDTTTDAPTNPGSPLEYPGAPALNAGGAPGGLTGCLSPALVEAVVTDPPGPAPSGVYTRVRWTGLGDLPPGGEIVVRYVAGIPLRANTTDWTGAIPPTTGPQASNLDNNSGPFTVDEQALTNVATATGRYDGATPVSDTEDLTRTAEDLRVLKSVDTSALTVGAISTWTLRISTSEYRFATGLVVTDTLPDGLCPRDTAACDPGQGAPSVTYTSAVENADGTWTLVWNRGTQAPTTDQTITFQSRTLTNYRQNGADAGPVLAGDRVQNDVRVDAQTQARCAPGDPTCTLGGVPIDDRPPGPDADVSSAAQAAGAPSIDKRVAVRAVPQDCAASTYVTGVQPGYAPGDRVCWRLRIDFPSSVSTGTVRVTDFLPPGFTYLAGSAEPTPDDTVPDGDVTFTEADLTWTVPSVAPGLVFEWRLASTITEPGAGADADIRANLMKVSYVDTEGESFPLRDEADVTWSEPVVTLTKGVAQINGAPVPPDPANTDNRPVQGGQSVTWRVDLGNPGTQPAEAVEVWDPLPAIIAGCSAVSGISDGGTCDDATRRITWTVPSLAVGGAETLTWDMQVPPGIAPGQNIVNTAGVRRYAVANNQNGTPVVLIPADNIDPAQNPAANAPAAKDPSNVFTPGVTLAKARTTSVVEPGNTAVQATIGETITWTFTFTVPEGTTLYGTPAVTDPVGARTTFLGNLQARLNGGALPAGVTATESGGVVRLDFPATYQNATGSAADVFTVSFDVRVDDEFPANQRGGTLAQHELPNTATAAWRDQGDTPRSLTAATSVEIVEPDIGVTKTVDDPDRLVEPGQVATFSLMVANPAAARVSGAKDVVLTDVLPPGLTLTDPGTASYDPAARTLTWADVPDLDPGGTATRTYRARVDAPATLRAVTNGAVVTTTSMSGAATGERTATSPGNPPGYRDADQVTLSLVFPALAITKATGLPGMPEEGPAEAGQPFPWLVVVRNAGTAPAYAVQIADTLPPGWTYQAGSAVLDPGGAQEPVVTPAATGDRLVWTLPGPLAPDAQAVVSLRAIPGPQATAITGIGPANPHVNTASVGGTDASGADRGPDGPYTAGPDPATAILSAPVLVITKTPDDRQVTPDERTAFTVLVRNIGDRAATGVTVTDVLPPQVAYTPDTASSDDGVITERSLTAGADGATTAVWGLADLPAGGQRVITVPVRVIGPLDDGTRITNLARVTSPLTPPSEDPGSLVVRSGARIDLAKSADRETVVVGDLVTYALRVSVTGNADARDVVVRDPLPAGLDFVSASDGGVPEGREVVWRLGRRAPGSTVALQLVTRVRALPPAGGEIPNTATATATDIPPVSATAVVRPPRPPEPPQPPPPGPRPPELVLGITGPAVLAGGQHGTWTITVRNR